MDEVLILLGKANPPFSKAALEVALKENENSCRSQQKFLNPRSTDTVVHKVRREDGGNTSTERCFIIAQSSLNEEHLKTIREGKHL